MSPFLVKTAADTHTRDRMTQVCIVITRTLKCNGDCDLYEQYLGSTRLMGLNYYFSKAWTERTEGRAGSDWNSGY